MSSYYILKMSMSTNVIYPYEVRNIEFNLMENLQHSSLSQLSRTQVERLIYIDFRLFFFGELGRSDVTTRFGIAPAGATRDIALYRKLAPANLTFDGSNKAYRPSVNFKPLFSHPPERALTALSKGFGDETGHEPKPLLRCETPLSLNLPKVDILATLSRAIHIRRPVHICYCSVSSGINERDIVPFALVDSGLRWHIRAFDRKSQTFRDFVLTRISNAEILNGDTVSDREGPENDLQWSRIIELDLVPHPSRARPEVVRMDYGIQGEALRVRVRAATAGYLLRLWNVDCSPDFRLRGPEYMLWLADPLALYGSETAVLAPGYQDPHHAMGKSE